MPSGWWHCPPKGSHPSSSSIPAARPTTSPGAWPRPSPASSGGLAMEFAYHGVSEAIDAFSPSNAPDHWHAPHIRLLPAPASIAAIWAATSNEPGERYAALAEPLIAELEAEGLWRRRGHGRLGLHDQRHSRCAGGLSAGRRRAGAGRPAACSSRMRCSRASAAWAPHFWGHRHHGVTPDFITIGKPAGNGHPVGAVITRPEILVALPEGRPVLLDLRRQQRRLRGRHRRAGRDPRRGPGRECAGRGRPICVEGCSG